MLNIERGAAVNLYADQNCTILAYMEVPYIKMHSASWFVMNWGQADLGPRFDPLNMHSHRARMAAVAAAAAGAPRKEMKLPRLVHLVPENQRRERRKRVMRRLRNFITHGMCIGGDLPDNLRSRSTATRTPTIRSGDQATAGPQPAEHDTPGVNPQSASQRLASGKPAQGQTLTAAETKSTLLEEEEENEDATDDSDAEHTARLHAAVIARSLSRSRSITGALQEDDPEDFRLSRHLSGSRAIEFSAQGSVSVQPPPQVRALPGTVHEPESCQQVVYLYVPHAYFIIFSPFLQLQFSPQPSNVLHHTE